MVISSSDLSTRGTYAIAHTARCKLNLNAGDPDRNLRFILGHSFLYEKALLRVAQIEDLSDADNDGGRDEHQHDNENDAKPVEDAAEPEGQSGSLAGGNVTFKDESTMASRQEDKSNSPEVEDEYDTADNDLSLQRFPSAAAQPPRMIPSSESDSDEDDEGPVSPPSLPADFDIRGLIEGQESEDLESLYESLRSCPCHGEKGEDCKGMWEVKDPRFGDGNVKSNKRLAIMRVDA